MAQITVQDVRIEDVIKGKNRYQVAHVVYTSNKGEQKEKRVMSFSNPSVFDTVKRLTSGTTVEVSYAKDDPYFNWAAVTSVAAQEAGATPTATPATAGKVLGSQYETRDERQTRQLHIVRQSSLSNAIALLSPGAKAALKVEDVLLTAQQLVDFVYDTEEILAPSNTDNPAVSEE